ncbi:MAG: hypothetical protein HY520_01455 [Candidatus Aenigmarchaeota archaeon]|nr:hypothetical protein [Candidatus Aenigmarchaeota archaeon]
MSMKPELKKRIWLRLFSHWATLYPIGGGAIVLMAGAVLPSPAAFLAGLIAFGMGVAHLGYEWAYRLGKIAQEESEKLQEDRRQEFEGHLDDLHQRLVEGDTDPQPEAMLEELRSLHGELRDMAAGGNPLAFTMMERAEELFKGCIQDLEQTILLHEQAARQAGAVRKQTLKAREDVKREVRKSVDKLAEVLGYIRSRDTGNGEAGGQEARRRELDILLDAALEVDRRRRGNLSLEGEKEAE